jgi:hypothetical protein
VARAQIAENQRPIAMAPGLQKEAEAQEDAMNTVSTVQSSQSRADAGARPLPRCRCGTDRTHRAATPEREYSIAGACYLLWGGTSIPTRIRFRCVHCGEVFDQSTERATCRAHII